jgi:predicted permease
MSTITQSIKLAVRGLVRRPAFSVVAILTLAIGIGATVAIFSIVNAVLLTPLPFKEPSRLVRIYSDTPKAGVDRYFSNEADLNDWRSAAPAFEEIAGYYLTEFNVVDAADEPLRIKAAGVTVNFLKVLGLDPVQGRMFTPEETLPGVQVVMVSDNFWRKRFGDRTALANQQIRMQQRMYSIVGVLPPNLGILEQTEVWIPQRVSPAPRGGRFLDIIGKLKPGVRVETAREELQTIDRRLEQEYAQSNRGWGVIVTPFQEDLVREVRAPLFVLLFAVTLVLLIACTNIANLQLALAEARQVEIAVRSALGASAAQVAKQLMVENITLSVIAGTVGAGLAYGCLALVRAFGPRDIPRLNIAGINSQILIFAAGVSILTGLLFGLAPIVRALQPGWNLSGGGTRGASSGPLAQRIRAVLVLAQIVLAVVLVNGAWAMLQNFSRLLDIDVGFRTEGVVAADIGLPVFEYRQPADVSNFYTRLIADLAADPSIQSVGAATSLPLRKDVDYRLPFGVTGRTPPANIHDQSAIHRMVTTGYFKTMGIPLKKGRDFAESDNAEKLGVVIVNEAFVRRYFPSEDPISKELRTTVGPFGPLGNTLFPRPQIVGVVADIRQIGLEQEPEPTIFFPHQQAPFRAMTVVARATGTPAAVANDIRRKVRALNPSLPISNVTTLSEVVSGTVAQPRFRTMVLGAFAVFALVLASIGIYGVTAYTVSQRTREIGVMVALGASPTNVFNRVLGRGLWLVGAAIVIGTLGALAEARLLGAAMFGVTPPSLLTMCASSALFALLAVAAYIVPVRRALSVDPSVILRTN